MSNHAPHLRLRSPRRGQTRASVDLLLVLACAGIGLGAQSGGTDPQAGATRGLERPQRDRQSSAPGSLGFRAEPSGADLQQGLSVDPVSATSDDSNERRNSP